MRVSEKMFDFLGIRADTRKEIQFDPTRAIVDDEFRHGPSSMSYRLAAIRRLIHLCIPWHTECNIVTEVVKEHVSLKCPYCHGGMTVQDVSGSGTHFTFNYTCKDCGSKASMSCDSENFLYFQPNEKDTEHTKG